MHDMEFGEPDAVVAVLFGARGAVLCAWPWLSPSATVADSQPGARTLRSRRLRRRSCRRCRAEELFTLRRIGLSRFHASFHATKSSRSAAQKPLEFGFAATDERASRTTLPVSGREAGTRGRHPSIYAGRETS